MGKFQIEKCEDIEGLYLIQPTVFGDSRGYFMETYNYEEFKEAGLDMVFRKTSLVLQKVFYEDYIIRKIIHRENLSEFFQVKFMM